MSEFKPMICVDTHELAWAAGFFDGEGNVSVSTRKKTFPQIVFQIAQTDRRPLDRFARAVGNGVVRGPYHHKDKAHQPYFVLTLHGFERVKLAVDRIWPWLSTPKREQARCALDTIESYTHTRNIWGAGRAALSLDQAKALRSEYEQLRALRRRIRKGVRAELAAKYGLNSINTVAAIVAGRGYN